MDCLPIVLLLFCGIVTCPLAVDIIDVDDYDPGTCDKMNDLQVVSILDRNDEKKLWICTEENGNYKWKPVSGDAYLGEFLYPARDCSDVLNYDSEADDGFYWVHFSISKIRKVWCDMKTDGGGYMLIARKHNADTWTVPSKDQAVAPHSSDTYWSSLLGDAPIKDFRVQISTTDSFRDTKAHWSFRLKNERRLEKLLIDDHGCDPLAPGIGDIAHVKDLITDKIVTTTFECSVFGIGHSSLLGWAMMNQCLKSPCGGSGKYHDSQGKPVVALDHTGVFSYSASDKVSGLHHDATAYIGCVRKKCCGCFGPVGGTGNYCNPQCSDANNGTIIDSDKVHTWIWVRSSLPKRIWNKCMEYQRQDSNGQLEWYNLVGDSAIPQKGRCSNAEELRLNSGVVVVPDSEAAKKVPAVPGLLAYRKDQKKLYVRANNTWNLLTKEKEVKGKLNELEKNISGGLAQLGKKLAFMIPQYKKYDEIIKVIKKHPECTSYTWSNESNRNENYYNDQSHQCDSYMSTGWYRFGGRAGTKMSTRCQTNNYCSTLYTGYLSGDHPALHEGIVSRSVCFRHPGGSCCTWSTSINVLNCGLYYVYHLTYGSIPQGCNSRYCSSF